MLCFAPIKAGGGGRSQRAQPAVGDEAAPLRGNQSSAPRLRLPRRVSPAAAATPTAGRPGQEAAGPAKGKGQPTAQARPRRTGRLPAHRSQGSRRRREGPRRRRRRRGLQDPTQAPSDGFLINGSVNNGAASPFAQSARSAIIAATARSLYNGNVGFRSGNSALDARSFSLTGQDIPSRHTTTWREWPPSADRIKLPGGNPMRRPNFVVNYQWMRDRNATRRSALMPTPPSAAATSPQTLARPSPSSIPPPVSPSPATSSRRTGSARRRRRSSNCTRCPISAARSITTRSRSAITNQDSLQARLNKTSQQQEPDVRHVCDPAVGQ